MTVAISEGTFAPERHIVQFYDDEPELVSAVAEFLSVGLLSGGAAVVVATPQSQTAFARALSAEGFDLLGATDERRYVAVDAAATLSDLIVGEQPDADRFAEVIGTLIDEVSATGRPVRVYGEMVALLWHRGNRSGAINLEVLWNELAAGRDFSLYCAYPMAAIAASADLRATKAVCDRHSLVVTPTSYALGVSSTDSSDDDAERSKFFLPVPLAPRAVRRFVVDALEDWHLHGLVDDAVLVVTELASNALVHASSPFRVVISRAAAVVRLAVHDASPLIPAPREAEALEAGGRGVGIVAELSQCWGYEPIPDGKVVWAELDSEPRAHGPGSLPPD